VSRPRNPVIQKEGGGRDSSFLVDRTRKTKRERRIQGIKGARQLNEIGPWNNPEWSGLENKEDLEAFAGGPTHSGSKGGEQTQTCASRLSVSTEGRVHKGLV